MSGEVVSHLILDKLREARSASDLSIVFDDIRDNYGVDHLVYHAVNVRGLTKDGAFLRLTYDDAWINQYYAQDYFSIDAVVEEGTRAFMPFSCSDLDWSTKKRREFAEDAKGHSISVSGLTVPMRGPGGQHALFSLASGSSEKDWERQLSEHLPELHTIAHHLHEATVRIEGATAPLEIVTLSIREREVLQWAAAGKTTDEISTILGIAERTVRVYLDTARHKLGASNRTHAVARALSIGLIHPPD